MHSSAACGQQEILRLLKDWSKLIADNLEDIILIIDRSAYIETAFCKYHFAKKLSAKFGELNSEIILKDVYNPFLLLNKKEVVPITVILEEGYTGMIISGPNAGGKSAALKCLALCADMFLKGLPIPAAEASMPLFRNVLIEIGDAQNLGNDLSTFSGHILNIKNILQNSDSGSLILIDEIAHATDPVEGEALACSIIDELIEKKSRFAITTHYKRVKYKSFESDGIKSYAAGFDTKKMMPLYTLYPNTVGESYALNIAEKMGLSWHIIKKTSEYLTDQMDKTALILSNVEQYEKTLRQKEQALLDAELKTAKLQEELAKEKSRLNELEIQLKSEGLSKADKELSFCLRELSHLQKQETKNAKEYSKKLSQVQKIIVEKNEEITNLSREKKTHINIGDNVFIASLNRNAVVEEISKNNVKVSVGRIKHSVKKTDIFEADAMPKKQTVKARYHAEVFPNVDLHGYRVEDAIPEMEKKLFSALNGGLNEFAVMHGKGTGVLQKAVREHLRTMPEVKSFAYAPPQEGGTGVTIVYFR